MRPVAITGIGVISPCGIGIDAFWAGLCAEPADGVERRVGDFDPEPWFGTKGARRTDRFAQFAVVAAAMALDDPGQPSFDPDRSGVILRPCLGGAATPAEQISRTVAKGD